MIPMNQLLMPEIKEIDVDDYLADSDVEQEEKEEIEEKGTRPSRRKQKAEQALSELGYLCRLRHTLSFVEEYNQDLLPAIQRNPKLPRLTLATDSIYHLLFLQQCSFFL